MEPNPDEAPQWEYESAPVEPVDAMSVYFGIVFYLLAGILAAVVILGSNS